jgi:hypothetical protein
MPCGTRRDPVMPRMSTPRVTLGTLFASSLLAWMWSGLWADLLIRRVFRSYRLPAHMRTDLRESCSSLCIRQQR